MSEAPRRNHEGSQIEIADEVRAEAAGYLQANNDLEESVLASDSALDVRAKILTHFGHTTELNPSPAPLLTELEKAVLAEAVGRWNKQRIADSQ